MRLAFGRPKMSKEQLERQAVEELEAAMARAKPPSESERTWAHGEASTDWSARAASLQSRAPAPAPAVVNSREDSVDSLRDELWSEEDQPGELYDDALDDVELEEPPAPAPTPASAPARPRAAAAPKGAGSATRAQPGNAKSRKAASTRSRRT